MRVEKNGISVILEFNNDTLGAYMQRKLKNARLIYSNKARIRIKGFQGDCVVVERDGKDYTYALCDGRIRNGSLVGSERSNYARLRILAYFPSEDAARKSPYAQYVCRWNQVHSDPSKELKRDALLVSVHALQKQLDNIRKQIEQL